MDEITLRQIRKVLNTEAAGLTDFEQTLIQWYFLMDQSRPSFAGFAATLKVEKLDRGVVEASLQKALGKLRTHLAKYKITSVNDVIYS